jgi:hypothetical protein
MMRLFAIGAVVACCAVGALPAGAGTTPKYLWATINYCDTEAHPNTVGIRASIPGDGDRTRMYLRFTAQYYDRAAQAWSTVKGNGVSPWQYVGSGLKRWKQGGWQFGGFAPAAGQTFTLRGVVDFKWTKRGRIIRTAHLNTKGGHPNTPGADPKTFSASLCQVS